jgi:L-iditol 2-dehydrogenase
VAVLPARVRLELGEGRLPAPGPGEALVRVEACGVCVSDVPGYLGETDFPRLLGHEVGGRIVALGQGVDGLVEGDRVAAWVSEGGYAEHVLARADRCHRGSREPLLLSLAEPLGCSLNAVSLTDPQPGDAIVIFGAGFMGNLVQLLAQLRGPRSLVVVDLRAEARERALLLGADAVVDPAAEDPGERVRGLGGAADVCFEVTGTQEALLQIEPCLRDHAKLCIAGFHRWQRDVPLGLWNWRAFDLRNAHFRDPRIIDAGMRGATSLIDRGILDLAPLVTHRYPLERIGEALADASSKPPGFCKAVVEPWPSSNRP